MRAIEISVLGLLALVLPIAACGSGGTARGQEVDTADPSSAIDQSPSSPEDESSAAVGGHSDTLAATALSSAFREASRRVLPAVVYVTVEREAMGRSQPTPLPEPFRYFFESPERGFEMPPQRGNGSGFIIDADGHVVTNQHVVADASHVTVRLHDGREYEAEVLASDANTDVAVLKLPEDAEDLPHARFRDSATLQVGDWVLALGNPLGLEFTVTAGIVSAKGRQLTARETALESYIQTDAAINPGNSGGPLIDLQGRVVGINSAISGGLRFVGYGFAAPSDLARRVIADLLEYGHVRRPRLGIRISDVTAVDAEVYGLEQVTGAEVVTVDEDAPAAEAGIQVGDVIVELDGEPVENANQLTTALAQHEPGDEVALTIVRDGRRRLTARPGEFPREQATEGRIASGETAEERMGFGVRPLSASIADRLGYDVDDGLVIARVEPYGPASRAGIRRGQLLLSINGKRVQDVEDYRRLAESIGLGDVVSVRVRDPEIGVTIINYRTR